MLRLQVCEGSGRDQYVVVFAGEDAGSNWTSLGFRLRKRSAGSCSRTINASFVRLRSARRRSSPACVGAWGSRPITAGGAPHGTNTLTKIAICNASKRPSIHLRTVVSRLSLATSSL